MSGQFIRAAALAITLASSAIPTYSQDSGAVDFAGDTIEMIVPFAAGGGSAAYAQLMAQFLGQELPGSPTVIVRNIEGAGSMVGMNHFEREAEPDGSMFASVGIATFYNYLLEADGVEYDLPNYRAFLSSAGGLVIYGRTDAGLTGDPVADLKTLQAMEPIYGGESPSGGDMNTLFALEILGVRPKAIFGLSNNEARAAFERGELQLRFDTSGSWEDAVKPMVDDGIAVPLFTFGSVDAEGNVIRDPLFPDLPTVPELYEQLNGEPMEGVEAEVWQLLLSVRAFSLRTFVLPAETPDQVYQAYADAMARVLALPELQTPEALEIIGPYPQFTGERSQAIFNTAGNITEEQRAWLINWLTTRFDANL